MDTIKGIFNHYRIELEVKKLPTDIYGLKYKPSVEPLWSDNADYHIQWGSKDCSCEIQDIDRKYISEFMNIHKDKFKTIVEIGVCRRDLEHSWTKYFIELKDKNTSYIGVDANDKSFLNNSENKIFTIKAWSHEINRVLEYIEKVTGKREIDLIFVDGDHSIRGLCTDMKYLQYLSKNGIALFHDISVHPAGLVFDAINEDMFIKEKVFLHNSDSSGIGVAYKNG